MLREEIQRNKKPYLSTRRAESGSLKESIAQYRHPGKMINAALVADGEWILT